VADAAVVGSALVGRVADGLDGVGKAKPGLAADMLKLVRELADGVRGARKR
jgi:tryptophan synthase alpha chain